MDYFFDLGLTQYYYKLFTIQFKSAVIKIQVCISCTCSYCSIYAPMLQCKSTRTPLDSRHPHAFAGFFVLWLSTTLLFHRLRNGVLGGLFFFLQEGPKFPLFSWHEAAIWRFCFQSVFAGCQHCTYSVDLQCGLTVNYSSLYYSILGDDVFVPLFLWFPGIILILAPTSLTVNSSTTLTTAQ